MHSVAPPHHGSRVVVASVGGSDGGTGGGSVASPPDRPFSANVARRSFAAAGTGTGTGTGAAAGSGVGSGSSVTGTPAFTTGWVARIGSTCDAPQRSRAHTQRHDNARSI